MSNAVLSDPSTVEVQPTRCKLRDNPAQFREIVQPDGSIITVCRLCGAYLSWVESKVVAPPKPGWQARGGRLEVA